MFSDVDTVFAELPTFVPLIAQRAVGEPPVVFTAVAWDIVLEIIPFRLHFCSNVSVRVVDPDVRPSTVTVLSVTPAIDSNIALSHIPM